MNVLYTIFIYSVWFLSTYFLILFLLLLLLYRDQLFAKPKGKYDAQEGVTFIVPTYNEEQTIALTIESLKKIEHKNCEFLVITDGCTDNSAKNAKAAIKNDKRFKLIERKQNLGKAATLNEGIKKATNNFIACMDADSVIESKIIRKTLPHFQNKDVGAVTVSVEVINPKMYLHNIFDVEFTIGLSLFLRALSFIDCVFVTPGPFSLYRKSVLEKIGGFDTKNITEDLEIAYRIHKAGYIIENALDAKVQTELPSTFKGNYVQRRRWYAGAIQTLFKHRNLLFNPKWGIFGFFIPFNYLLIFCGLILFYYSSFLFIGNAIDWIQGIYYTGFDIHNFSFTFDILTMGNTLLLGYLSLISTFVILFVSLKITRKSYIAKIKGIIGYPLLFFLYQLYWLGGIKAALTNKKVKWR